MVGNFGGVKLSARATVILSELLCGRLNGDFAGVGACVVLSGSDHAVFDLTGHCDEGLFNVGRVLRRGLDERDAQRCREVFGDLEVYRALGGEITFVSHQQFVNVLAGIALDLAQPLLHVREAHLICHVVNHDDSMRSPVIARCDCAEPLLAGRVWVFMYQ